MFGKKQTDDTMTNTQRDQLLVYAVGGATDGPSTGWRDNAWRASGGLSRMGG